jgi:hypothetical protein
MVNEQVGLEIVLARLTSINLYITLALTVPQAYSLGKSF